MSNLGGASVAAHCCVPVKAAAAHLHCIYNIGTVTVENIWSHE